MTDRTGPAEGVVSCVSWWVSVLTLTSLPICLVD